MTQTTIDRLRARGDVQIDAHTYGYSVIWWPKGQKGNPFCARSASGPELEPLVVQLEEATRPPSRDWDEARYAREWQAEEDARAHLRFAMSTYDSGDRYRERRAREAEERRIKRERRLASQERQRVRQVLTG